jgi:hypothetical protein
MRLIRHEVSHPQAGNSRWAVPAAISRTNFMPRRTAGNRSQPSSISSAARPQLFLPSRRRQYPGRRHALHQSDGVVARRHLSRCAIAASTLNAPAPRPRRRLRSRATRMSEKTRTIAGIRHFTGATLAPALCSAPGSLMIGGKRPYQRLPARSTGPPRFAGVPGRTASRAAARATGLGRSTTPGLTMQPAGYSTYWQYTTALAFSVLAAMDPVISNSASSANDGLILISCSSCFS